MADDAPDPLFDGIWNVFHLPVNSAGEMIFGGCNARDEQEVMRAIRHAEREATRHCVRAVSFEGFDISSRPKEAEKMLVEMQHLERISLSGCGLTADCLTASVSRALPRLPRFEKPYTDMDEDETVMKAELNLSGNQFDRQGFIQFCRALGKPLRGVGKLHLSNTQIDDECLRAIAGCFPGLETLHLHDTNITGSGGWLRKVIPLLPQLKLLNLDNTPFSDEGATELHHALKERRLSGSLVPLEIWLRSVPAPTSDWLELLGWCSDSKNNGLYHVKHDLLATTRARGGKQSVQTHETVELQIMMTHRDPISITYRDVVCTKEVMQMARECINELKTLCSDYDRKAPDRLTAERRQKYRDALNPLHREGKLIGKKYVLGSVVLKQRNKYTRREETVVDLSKRLLGRPKSHLSIILQVEAELQQTDPR